jgi:uncharacterized protein YjbI with pentapeptide repeats
MSENSDRLSYAVSRERGMRMPPFLSIRVIVASRRNAVLRSQSVGMIVLTLVACLAGRVKADSLPIVMCAADAPYAGKTMRAAELLRSPKSGTRVNYCGVKVVGPVNASSDFSDLLLDMADFSGAELNQVRFDRTKLEGANFDHAKLFDVSFARADVTEADFSNLKATHVDFEAANLDHANFTNAKLEQVSFREANMRGSTLTRTQISYSLLQKANLQGADLTSSLITITDLQGANLEFAKLSGAVLDQVDLRECNFDGTYLGSVTFDPRAGGVPSPDALGGVDIDDQLIYRWSPVGLIALRKGMVDAGRVREARQVTYAIERRRTEIELAPEKRIPC